MKKPLVIAAILALLTLLLARRVGAVSDSDMDPTFLPGDFLLVLPLSPKAGDVVALPDPLDPDHWTLRRVVATAGTVRYASGVFEVTEDPVSRSFLGDRDADFVVFEEGHLARHRSEAIHWEMAPVVVPSGHLFLASDHRESAVDSRWWGTVPAQEVSGVVVARLGRPVHPWRGWWGIDEEPVAAEPTGVPPTPPSLQKPAG